MMAPSLLPWLCVTLYNQMQNITTREMRRDMKWVSTLDFHITHLRHLLQQKSAFHIYLIRCLELCLTQKWHHFDIIISAYVVLNLYDFFFLFHEKQRKMLWRMSTLLFSCNESECGPGADKLQKDKYLPQKYYKTIWLVHWISSLLKPYSFV